MFGLTLSDNVIDRSLAVVPFQLKGTFAPDGTKMDVVVELDAFCPAVCEAGFFADSRAAINLVKRAVAADSQELPVCASVVFNKCFNIASAYAGAKLCETVPQRDLLNGREEVGHDDGVCGRHRIQTVTAVQAANRGRY